MQSKTQTYNMYHSKTFLHCKELAEIMEKEDSYYWLGQEDSDPEPMPESYNDLPKPTRAPSGTVKLDDGHH